MMLKYYIKDGKKIYTLKLEIEGQKTKEAHYKFIKRDVPRSNVMIN